MTYFSLLKQSSIPRVTYSRHTRLIQQKLISFYNSRHFSRKLSIDSNIIDYYCIIVPHSKMCDPSNWTETDFFWGHKYLKKSKQIIIWLSDTIINNFFVITYCTLIVGHDYLWFCEKHSICMSIILVTALQSTYEENTAINIHKHQFLYIHIHFNRKDIRHMYRLINILTNPPSITIIIILWTQYLYLYFVFFIYIFFYNHIFP